MLTASASNGMVGLIPDRNFVGGGMCLRQMDNALRAIHFNVVTPPPKKAADNHINHKALDSGPDLLLPTL